ncbi:hypothetical protein ACH9EU_16880 [Kocuria sp. M1R5S2]|uniref:hypothetical protein n=1 Tax=Kocuria rhizosphaerae TaxID=3376285 RepID=UPI0037A4CC16
MADAISGDPPILHKKSGNVHDSAPLPGTQGETARNWYLTQEWLRMAAGLKEVIVHPMDENHPSNWMCKPAAEYAAARNDQVSLITTEYTRHLYISNALDRYLEYLALPSPKNKGNWVKATYFLQSSGASKKIAPWLPANSRNPSPLCI